MDDSDPKSTPPPNPTSGSWIDEYVATEEGDFHVRSWRGLERSDPILLIHGLWASVPLWDEITRKLAGADINPVSIDLLGHGASSKPRRLFTIEDHASSVLALLGELGWDTTTLIGNSMGALVSLAAASAGPDHITRLITFGCPAWASQLQRQEWLHARTEWLDMATGMPQHCNAIDESATARALAENYDEIGIWILNSMWALYAYDAMRDLSHLRCEFHAFYGEHDWLIETRSNLLCARAHLGIVPQAGHGAPFENPSGVAEAIQRAMMSK